MSTPPHAVPETYRFGVAGDADNRRDAAVQVMSYELFAGSYPVPGGAYDARMGTTDHHWDCATCGLPRKADPGHPGLLRANAALVSPLFVPEVRRWLRVVCLSCGAPVVDLERFRRLPAAVRLAEASKAQTEGAACPACGAVHPKIWKTEDDKFTFEAQWSAERKERLTYDAIRATFERVTDATAAALGRPYPPRHLALRDVLVPPNTIRPGVRTGFAPAGSASHHDLTNLVQYLVRRNGDLAAPPEAPAEAERQAAVFQQLYYDLVMASAANAAAKGAERRRITAGSRAVASLMSQLARKYGILRRFLLGKRVRNISRMTISGNPKLRVNEVGVPVAIARALQVAEVVQPYNRDRLRVFFANGTRAYPGSSRVVRRATGATHSVDGLPRDAALEDGDVLHRDVVSGDLAYFNRAPSLERSAIGVHRVVVIHDAEVNTFQMNVAACSFYNADFDGDQMNLWVPHTAPAEVEAGLVSAVENWFVSTKTSGPATGQVQDSNVGCFALTRAAVRMDKLHAMRLFAETGLPPPDFGDGADARATFTGRDVVSRLFARTPVTFSRGTRWFSETYAPFVDYDPSEARVEMSRGVLRAGVLDKNSIGDSPGSVFHLVARDFGPGAALDMIFALQQVALAFMQNRGFTVGPADMVLPPAPLAEVRRIAAGLRRDATLVGERLARGEIVPPVEYTTREYFEHLQLEALRTPDELLGPVLSAFDPDTNGLLQMVLTGSKGSVPNLFHIAALIGSVTIHGRRLGERFGHRRTSPYFPRFTLDPAAYGFVDASYIDGIGPTQYLAVNQGNRTDLIAKALSTSETGYRNRKDVKALEANVVDNLRRVTKDTRVAQFLYGDDGLDARGVERVRFRSVFLDDAALVAAFGWPSDAPPPDPAARATLEAAVDAVRADRDAYRAAFLRLEDADFAFPLEDARLVPVDVGRLVRDVRARRAGPAPARAPAEAAAMWRRVAAFCEELPYALLNARCAARRAPLPDYVRAATGLLAALVRAELAPATLAGLADGELEYVLGGVRVRLAAALVDPGTCAGVVAAQCVSEPLTQYMLDSHHRSVGSGTNKAGIIRPSEIFGARPVEAERSPEMLLRLRPDVERDRAAALAVANQVELLTLGRFVAAWDLLLEPFGETLYPPFRGDAGWLADFRRHHPLLAPPADLTNWCARFELDKTLLVLKGMRLETLVARLRAAHPAAFFAHASENAPAVVVRAYFRASRFRGGGGEEKAREAVAKDLLPTVLRGVPGILAARVVELRRHAVGEGGGLRPETVYAVRTVGTNIYGVLAHRAVDPARVVSSSVGDTLRMFGVAAARNKIVSEIRRFMESKAPNVRHLHVYADEMTRTGRYTSLEKGGIAVRERSNVLLRMAMSAPTQVLQDAAAAGIGGRLYGISPFLLLGCPPPIGTFFNEFALDEEFVRDKVRSVDAVLDEL